MVSEPVQLEIEGIDVYVEGQGPDVIVMIHGWPDTHRLWDAQVAALQAHHRCVRFTLPGFDLTKERRAYSLSEMLEVFKHIIEQTSPGRPVTLLLHDWGCVFGYQLAMHHPALVARIIGVDVGDAGSPAFTREFGLLPNLLIFGYQSWLALAWRIGGPVGDQMTLGMATVLRTPSDRSQISSGMNFPYYIEWTGSYGSYRQGRRFDPECPMLYIYGQRKPFMFHSSAWAQALAQRPGCKVLAFDTGHWVMSEQPERFNEEVLRWLGPVDTRSAPAKRPPRARAKRAKTATA